MNRETTEVILRKVIDLDGELTQNMEKEERALRQEEEFRQAEMLKMRRTIEQETNQALAALQQTISQEPAKQQSERDLSGRYAQRHEAMLREALSILTKSDG